MSDLLFETPFEKAEVEEILGLLPDVLPKAGTFTRVSFYECVRLLKSCGSETSRSHTRLGLKSVDRYVNVSDT